jgi:hypothetical protein
MPPDLDIYAITRHRDRATIEQFLDEYVDRNIAEERGDEDLLLENPAYFTEDWTGQRSGPIPETAFETEPAYTLSHIIERGLDRPRRAFAAYLTAKAPDLDRVILALTRDDQLVLGLSIDDTGARPENEVKAKALLADLMATYRCHAGIILVEDPPPLGEAEFRARTTQSLVVAYVSPDHAAH